MIAAIMCGGKGNRMRSCVKIEKPLLKLKGKPMIERVLGSVIKSEEFRKIIAVTSHHTPTTESFVVRNFSRCVDVIRSEGQGYSEDTSVVIHKLKPERVHVVPADLQ